jgi:uncharacterized protein with HEPN domain
MSRRRVYSDYVRDILEEIQLVIQFTQDISFDDFLSDRKTQRAVEKCLGNMGEASKRIPDSIRKKYPEIPFKQMSQMREIVVHDYDGINYMIVWETVTKELPPMEERMEELLHALECEERDRDS